MYCIKCGKELPNDALFCYHCGSRVYNPESPTENQNINASLSDAKDKEIFVHKNSVEVSQIHHRGEEDNKTETPEDVSNDFKILSKNAQSLKQVYFE
jgi:hypothetical protein